MKGFTRSIATFFVIFIFFTEGFGQAETNKSRLLNVKDNKAMGDGKADDTKAIQATISQANKGDTVWIPEGTYLVKALGLKSGVHIKGEGLLVQQLAGEKEGFSPSKQNSSAPLFRGSKISDVNLSIRARTLNEAVYLSGSRNIRISQSTFMGDSTNRNSFAGILLYDCENVSIENSTISHYGTDRRYADTYQPGTAIRILSSNEISVTHCNILDNGENGVFMHDTSNVEVSNCHIKDNGMSAIQVAFGANGVEKNFKFVNNLMEDNAADAIDINNRSERKFLNINCLIEGNTSLNNGFVNGESTRDGSGIATLINISGLKILNNKAEGNNRPALYIESCGTITATGNTADNQVEVVLEFEELKLHDNTFSIISLLANSDGKKLLLTGNKLHSMSLPNGIQVDSLIVKNNLLTNATLNFNMTGHVRLLGNTINSHAKDGAILIVRVNSAHLEENHITSNGSHAIAVRKMATNVSIINNDIKSVNTCILDDGSKRLKISGNQFLSLEGGRFRHTLVSRNPDGIFLSKNTHKTARKENAILLQGSGTAHIIDEKIIRGKKNYGSVKVKETQQ